MIDENADYKENSDNSLKKKKKRWLAPLLIVIAVFVFVGGFFAWKTGFTFSKISTKGSGGFFDSLAHAIPGVKDTLKGEEEDRINIALLGMRGENDSSGGTLADTIIVASIEPKANRIALVSVPRDLWVKNPGTQSYSKINAVHAYGEEDGKGQGLSQMEKVLEEVLGSQIHYAVKIDFKGFVDLVDAIGGVEITLDKPFEEGVQFNKPHVCDSYFTVPTGEYENKTVTYFSESSRTYKKRIVASYPLCTAPSSTLECGGNFKLPAGTQTLNAKQTLCFVRSRETSSDFERAKRQQIIIKEIQKKVTSIGTLSDFSKVNAILDALGNNVKTDMQAWEMKRLYDLYKTMQSPQIAQRVLENSQEGLLYVPAETPERGYTLQPIGDNYDRIHEMFKNIFTLPEQSDIKPK
ncbi:MAG TPA: LCP family protein [Candidatus Moranbacteria bacterium]|nr:LCP family protein [Candidatus Moranbacteria bacterium]HRZ33876.1 LCP family protein [Candidatus Moranbacteria bacterium]